MFFKKGRYSGFIRPVSYVLDLFIINYLAKAFFFAEYKYLTQLMIYASLAWLILSFRLKFYEIYRHTRVVRILTLILLQAILFSMAIYAFFGYFSWQGREQHAVVKYVFTAFSLITVFKFTLYFLLRKYRSFLGGNIRKVVILGKNKKTEQLQRFFTDNPEYGYDFQKMFDLKSEGNTGLEDCFRYINENYIDEIYVSVAEHTDEELSALTDFADNNLKTLKYLPDNREIYTRRLDYDYYGYLPILYLRKIPLRDTFNMATKRIFDMGLSLVVVVGVLSWLTPLLAILIKLDSKGPVFFKQVRNGLDYKEFYCYKFRSMVPNPESEVAQTSKGDQRVTRLGRFLRKTSLDEMPQFINVLKGDMSVVGPRPHPINYANDYARRIDKFMVRHFIKPGITGLAQVSGYRGAIETDEDIINRVRLDIFYVENWSLFFDLKIILQTIYNAVRGDQKAY